MKRRSQRKLGTIAVGLLLALSGAREAMAGGLWIYEMGGDEVGLATAGYASRAQDPSTVATNPAGMTRLSGMQVQGGLAAIYDNASFSPSTSVNSAGGGDGGTPVGLAPTASVFITRQLTPEWTAGFGIAGNFGGNLKYDSNWMGRYWDRESDLLGISLLPSIAYRVNSQWSVGATVNAMYGTMTNKVAVNNILPSYGDGQLELEDHHWGWGGNLGVLYELNPGARVGFTYNSQVNLNFRPAVQFSGLAPGRNAIFGALGILNSHINQDIRVPQGAMLSGYYELNKDWAILADIGWQQWSRFGEMAISIQDNSVTSRTITTQLNYLDTTHVAAGAQRHFGQGWTLDFGAAYDSGFQKSSDTPPSLPANEQLRLAVGGHKEQSKNLSWGVAFEYVHTNTLQTIRSTPVPVAIGGRGDLIGSYNDPSMLIFSANASWKF